MYPKSPFFTLDSHYQRLLYESSRKPSKVFIASFGLNVGLYDKGSGEFYSTQSLTRKFLDSLRGIEVDLLIGFPAQRKGESYDTFSRRRAMFKKAMGNWPEFNWRISDESHLKCVGFERKDSPYCVIAGGRNLTDSGFSDISLVVPKRQRVPIKKHFYKLFKQAKKM